MVINQMVNRWARECSCTGYSTLQAQHLVRPITSPSRITGLGSDPRRGNPRFDVLGSKVRKPRTSNLEPSLA